MSLATKYQSRLYILLTNTPSQLTQSWWSWSTCKSWSRIFTLTFTYLRTTIFWGGGKRFLIHRLTRLSQQRVSLFRAISGTYWPVAVIPFSTMPKGISITPQFLARNWNIPLREQQNIMRTYSLTNTMRTSPSRNISILTQILRASSEPENFSVKNLRTILFRAWKPHSKRIWKSMSKHIEKTI